MTKCEKIMVRSMQERGLSVREELRLIRGDRKNYVCDEATYYVESRHPYYREDRPNFYVPVIMFTWSLARAMRRAYEERKRGWKATIHNNMTDEVINPKTMSLWQKK